MRRSRARRPRPPHSQIEFAAGQAAAQRTLAAASAMIRSDGELLFWPRRSTALADVEVAIVCRRSSSSE